jgi:hypothetical protein
MSKSTTDVLDKICGNIRRRVAAGASGAPSAPAPTPAVESPVPRSPVVPTSGPPSRRRGKRVIGGDDVDSEEARREARPVKRTSVEPVNLPGVQGVEAWKISHDLTPCNAPTVTCEGQRSAECYYQRRDRGYLVGVDPPVGRYLEGCGGDIDRILRKGLERASEVGAFDLLVGCLFLLASTDIPLCRRLIAFILPWSDRAG